MWDYLRDPAWATVLSAVSILLAIIVPLGLVYFSHKRKELVFERPTYHFGLLPEVESSQIDVLFSGEELAEPFFLPLTFRNGGGQPIVVSDFERPMTIRFEKSVRVYSATAVAQNPLDLNPQIVIGVTNDEGASVTITPLLLNPKDSFTVSILGDNPLSLARIMTSVDARIAGVRTIRYRWTPEKDWQDHIPAAVISLWLIPFLALVFYSLGSKYGPMPQANETTMRLAVLCWINLLVGGLSIGILRIVSRPKRS